MNIAIDFISITQLEPIVFKKLFIFQKQRYPYAIARGTRCSHGKELSFPHRAALAGMTGFLYFVPSVSYSSLHFLPIRDKIP